MLLLQLTCMNCLTGISLCVVLVWLDYRITLSLPSVYVYRSAAKLYGLQNKTRSPSRILAISERKKNNWQLHVESLTILQLLLAGRKGGVKGNADRCRPQLIARDAALEQSSRKVNMD